MKVYQGAHSLVVEVIVKSFYSRPPGWAHTFFLVTATDYLNRYGVLSVPSSTPGRSRTGLSLRPKLQGLTIFVFPLSTFRRFGEDIRKPFIQPLHIFHIAWWTTQDQYSA